MDKQYYITYRNCGKPERTPVMPDTPTNTNSKHNVKLLKLQGATAVRIHREVYYKSEVRK